MAIHVLRGLCAVCYATYGYDTIIRQGIKTSSFINTAKMITEGPIKDFIDKKAKEMGIKKEIIVIDALYFRAYGNNLFPGKIVLKVPQESGVSKEMQVHIIHHLAHVKANDFLMWASIPLIVAIFISIKLNFFSPTGACLAGFAMGMVTLIILCRWREKKAELAVLKYGTKEIQEAALSRLQEQKIQEEGDSIVDKLIIYIKNLMNPSKDALIREIESHFRKTHTTC